jgi:spermidine synthase
MLLNEFTKYPSLELIVGLELDQRVTRGSYKHHGTQPHFDQDRVEWWFGDATKSLLMLPKSYFGTFDLVIVDLSETIMSEKVTEELDVLDMLTLLLQPDGIMLKNEFYFGKFKQMFSHSVMVHW